jgi:hypothetical protein
MWEVKGSEYAKFSYVAEGLPTRPCMLSLNLLDLGQEMTLKVPDCESP